MHVYFVAAQQYPIPHWKWNIEHQSAFARRFSTGVIVRFASLFRYHMMARVFWRFIFWIPHEFVQDLELSGFVI